MASRTWREYYKELKAFRRSHGHCRTSDKSSFVLHQWVKAQREKKHQLSPEQVRRLTRIGFDWETKEMKLERMWNSNFELLKQFNREHGHTRVKPSDGKQLYHWVGRQREIYRLNKIPAHRVRKLERIGFEWYILGCVVNRSSRHDDGLWHERFQDYCCYMKSHPNTMVPKRFLIKHEGQREYDLNGWVSFQRQRYKDGILKEDRIEKLESIGFKFDCEDHKSKQLWDKWFGKLVDFKEKNGSCNVPDDWGECPQLSKWVSKQRAKQEQYSLSSVRFRKLDSIGCFQEQHNEGTDMRMLAELQEFKGKHGHCRIGYHSTSPLERWASDIRNRWKTGTMDPEQVATLNRLRFEWYPPGLPIAFYDVKTAKRKLHPILKHSRKASRHQYEQTVARHSRKGSKHQYKQVILPVKGNAKVEQSTAT